MASQGRLQGIFTPNMVPLDEARQAQTALSELFDAILLAADFPEGFRTAIELRGFRMGTGRQPLSDEHRAALAKLQERLAALLAREGLTATPSPAAPIDPHQVSTIVAGVLTALQQRGAL